MKAFIYAAGVGLRLSQSFGTTPKVLLEFGGKTLLEWHVIRLLQAGVSEVWVVSGYEREKVQACMDRLSAEYPVSLKGVVNEAYEEGSVLSMGVTVPLLGEARDPVLIMDGDVLYPSEMLGRLLRSPARTCLLVDRHYLTEDDDPVLVPVKEGRPFDFCKKWQGEAEEIGESVGFFKVDPADLPELVGETMRWCREDRQGSYDDILRALVRRGLFGCEDITGLPWTEVDFPKDVARAAREVMPAIEALETAAASG